MFLEHECAYIMNMQTKSNLPDLDLLTKYFVTKWPQRELIERQWDYGVCIIDKLNWDEYISLIENIKSSPSIF